MLELLTQQDKLANLAKDISGRVVGRSLSFPEPLQADFIIYVKTLLRCSGSSTKVINELDELLRLVSKAVK